MGSPPAVVISGPLCIMFDIQISHLCFLTSSGGNTAEENELGEEDTGRGGRKTGL